MLFNSLIFLIFAACFFALWPAVKQHTNRRYLYLTVASFVFYGWWDWRYLLLIIASGLLDFAVGLAMAQAPQRRGWLLVTSLVGNLGLLASFKYSTFLASNLDQMLQSLALTPFLVDSLPEFVTVLPVGISFYTFQSMSYTIDIYRGQLTPTRNPLHFFAYLSMFPQLVAGPIVRASELLPQLTTHTTPDAAARFEGTKLIIYGYFKKVVIADNLAPIVNTAFGTIPMSTDPVYWWIVMTAFAFQIYCDFSGYSLIARGLAKWMGYEFPVNFNHPYAAQSLREFWTRWHISLSTWFRDYVYIGLGGSRQGPFRAHLNMWLTMVLSGLWHGASWNFVLWGAVHAAFLSLERLTNWPTHLQRLPGGGIMAATVTLFQVWLAWVFFRAVTLEQALHILTTMFSLWTQIDGIVVLILLVTLVSLYTRHVKFINQQRTTTQSPRLPDLLFWAMLVTACVFLRGQGNEFIYFQF